MKNSKRVFIINSELGARLHLNKDISVTVLAVSKGQVRLGFAAPTYLATPYVIPNVIPSKKNNKSKLLDRLKNLF